MDSATISVSQLVTCPCCASDSVDVDLGEARGVVVNDDLDCWNIQTTAKEEKMMSRFGKVGPSKSTVFNNSHKVALKTN